jgi:hypothetical protein
MSLSHSGVISFDKGEIVGYGSMVIALSMIFFGIKSYRDNHQSGAIKFLKGLQVGILITLIASLMYAASWEVYLLTSSGGQEAFMRVYSERYIDNMKNKGATEAEIEKMTRRLAEMTEMYKNPVIRFGMTLMEILPVGVIITLISAAVLRKKEVLPV